MTANSHEFFEVENLAKELGVKFRFDAEIFLVLTATKLLLSLGCCHGGDRKEFSDKERHMHWEKYFEKTKGQTVPEALYNCGAGLPGSILIRMATFSRASWSQISDTICLKEVLWRLE